jgi:hypothetical protein
MIILPLIIGMNLIEFYDMAFFESFSLFRGRHTDFGALWYTDVGRQIVSMMLVFMIRPIFEFGIEYATLRLKRWWYKKSVKREDKPGFDKTYDYIEFLELHAGPEYNFYYKTANTTIMVFITLIFGPALPVLYIISLIAIGSAYFIDRLALTYFYRIPPKYSEKLTLLNLKIMSFAPIISLVFTFWLYNNQ